MKNRKKLRIVLSIFLLLFSLISFVMNCMLSDYIPWTKTDFGTYQEFYEIIYDKNSFAASDFRKEIPNNSKMVKYYWHQHWGEKYAAYSAILEDDEYVNIVNERLEFYRNQMTKRSQIPMYELFDKEYLYIEESGWYEESRLAFVDSLMLNAGTKDQYYFLFLVNYKLSRGICYNGVLVNDTTHEIIEFSVELKDSTGQNARRLYGGYNDFKVDSENLIFREELPVSAHNMKYYVLNDEMINKSGYRATFSSADYAAVKQERMDYYQSALFECKDADDYVGERYVCLDGEKQYLNSVNLEDKRIDYLDALLTEEEKGQFYLGCSRFKDHEKNYYYQYYRYDAVLFNDETCEMIEVSYFGPRELEEEDELTGFEMAIGVLLLIREFVFDMLWI